MTQLALAGRAALITAGGTGIGFACAERLLIDGCSVTIAARREEVLRAATDRLRLSAPAGASVHHAVCDVADESALERAMEIAAEAEDGLDYVIASAGTGSLGTVFKTSREEFESVITTNLTGTFLTLKQGAQAILRSGRAGGAMVAVSSTAAAQMHSLLGVYGASKAGIDMLVTHLADELGPHGIRVNSLRPGIVETEMMEIPMQADELVNDYVRQMPLGRVGQPTDVAEAVRFLVGPESSWITGVRLDIDGGMHIRRAARYDHLANALFGEEAAASFISP